MSSDTSKYKNLDQVIQKINSKYITPADETARQYVDSFQDFFNSFRKVLYDFAPVLKSYKKIQYAGSNYDSLVAGTYKEFDMDMLINLTDNITVALSPPGSVQLKLNLPPGMDADRVKIFKTWLDSRNYITPDKFRTWGESVVDKSLNTLPKHNNLPMVSGKEGHYVVLKNSKSGPAFTLRVNKLNTNIIFDIDIVFCLEFKNWPSNFPNYGVSVNEWQAVPKTPKLQLGEGYKNWRYSFPKYEKDLISGTYHLRSVIKLIKKLRDTNNMSYLYSYSIKSIFLWELKNKNGLKWNDSVGYLFVMMLKKLKEYIDSGKIPFYWDKNSNLLDSLSPNQLNDCKITLNRLLRDIEKCVENPNDLTKILLTSEEQQSFAN